MGLKPRPNQIKKVKIIGENPDNLLTPRETELRVRDKLNLLAARRKAAVVLDHLLVNQIFPNHFEHAAARQEIVASVLAHAGVNQPKVKDSLLEQSGTREFIHTSLQFMGAAMLSDHRGNRSGIIVASKTMTSLAELTPRPGSKPGLDTLVNPFEVQYLATLSTTSLEELVKLGIPSFTAAGLIGFADVAVNQSLVINA